MVDASKSPSHQDAYIGGIIERAQKAGVLVLNKWDLVEGEKEKKETELLFREVRLRSLHAFREGLRTYGQGNEEPFPQGRLGIRQLREAVLHVGTEPCPGRHHEAGRSPEREGKRIQIRYGTQIGHGPPRLALFGNSDAPPPESYMRYLKNRLSEVFGLEGTPLILHFRKG